MGKISFNSSNNFIKPLLYDAPEKYQYTITNTTDNVQWYNLESHTNNMHASNPEIIEQIKTIEVPVEIIKEIIVEKPIHTIEYRTVEVEKPIYVEKIVEVEKIIEVEKPIEIIKFIENRDLMKQLEGKDKAIKGLKIICGVLLLIVIIGAIYGK